MKQDLTRRVIVTAAAVLAMATGMVSPVLLAEEVEVKNDAVDDFAAAVIVGDFAVGEEAAARLTTPCDGVIVAVQILWLEGTAGHPESIEQAIHIYDGSTFPAPGTELEVIEAPVLTPGFWNEFRYLDETGTIPLSVPVTSGQSFYVSLEFANPTDVGSGGPSVVRDINGCQTGKNSLYAIPGTWWNACLLGITGDWAIRAIVDCGFAGSTVDCNLDCTPASGTVPFQSALAVTLTNSYTGQVRRIAGRLNVTLANQSTFSNWKAGYTNVLPGASQLVSWNQTFPAVGSIIGQNFFHLVAEDVTPSPFNQPPYPAAGDTATSFCVVSAFAP